jgi:uncharacterized ParB-like nuclease family protein
MKIIQYPTKYISIDKLLELPFNRKKSEKQIRILMKAIVAKGVARKPFIVITRAITGKLEYYIIDGQHLVEACKRLGIDKLECMYVENESISWMVNMMAGLNNINQKWTLIDYVDAYCGTGSENFFKLKNHSIVNGLSVAVSASILSGTNVAGKAINPIKDGTFKVSNVEHDVITQNLLEVSSLVNTNSAKFHKAYLSFYRSLNGKYNHKKLMDKIKDNKNFKNIPHDSGYIYDLIHKTYTGK